VKKLGIRDPKAFVHPSDDQRFIREAVWSGLEMPAEVAWLATTKPRSADPTIT